LKTLQAFSSSSLLFLKLFDERFGTLGFLLEGNIERFERLREV
jgi:hypothetical protein